MTTPTVNEVILAARDVRAATSAEDETVVWSRWALRYSAGIDTSPDSASCAERSVERVPEPWIREALEWAARYAGASDDARPTVAYAAAKSVSYAQRATGRAVTL
jgi:hypothetical protein